jgi:hypothetical protein
MISLTPLFANLQIPHCHRNTIIGGYKLQTILVFYMHGLQQLIC